MTTRPPAGAWDEHGHNVLPDLLAHRYFGDFKVLPFQGFAEPHSLELDLGEAVSRRPAVVADAWRDSNTFRRRACTQPIKRTCGHSRRTSKRW